MRFRQRSLNRRAREPVSQDRHGLHPDSACDAQRRAGKPPTLRAALRPDDARGTDSQQDTSGTCILRLSRGRCNDEDLRRLRDFCRQCVRPGRRRVVLDLSHVWQADTRLVAMLVYVLRLARRAHVRLELRRSPELDALLDLCGVRHLLQAMQRPDAGSPRPSHRQPEQTKANGP